MSTWPNGQIVSMDSIGSYLVGPMDPITKGCWVIQGISVMLSIGPNGHNGHNFTKGTIDQMDPIWPIGMLKWTQWTTNWHKWQGVHLVQFTWMDIFHILWHVHWMSNGLVHCVQWTQWTKMTSLMTLSTFYTNDITVYFTILTLFVILIRFFY